MKPASALPDDLLHALRDAVRVAGARLASVAGTDTTRTLSMHLRCGEAWLAGRATASPQDPGTFQPSPDEGDDVWAAAYDVAETLRHVATAASLDVTPEFEAVLRRRLGLPPSRAS